MSSSDSGELSVAEKNLRQPEGKIPFYKFVLTGGPCGGKTTGLARLSSFLRERGFLVCSVPEAFTLMVSNGMSPGDLFPIDGMDAVLQNSVMDVQLSLEASLETVLRGSGKPSILLCDRGPLDGSVYLSDEKWNAILKNRQTDVTDLREKRYDAVLHLVTAADGAEAHYSLENNEVRTESPELAREVDKRTMQAWLGHPHQYVFDNTTDFEGKMKRLVDRISYIVGLPTNLSRRSYKYLLRKQPNESDFPSDVKFQKFEVEKAYITNQDGDKKTDYSFIRKRTTIDEKGNPGGSSYQLTTVQGTSNGEVIEQKRIITGREYAATYKARDVKRHVVQQLRISFLYKLQSFTIHVYQNPNPGLCILHVQVEITDSKVAEVVLPPFLEVERKLGGSEDENRYGAYSLSIIGEN